MVDGISENQPVMNWSHHTLVLNVCNQMMNADMANSRERFFKAANWFVSLMIPHFSNTERTALEAQYKAFEKASDDIRTAYKNEVGTTSENLLILKEAFAHSIAPLGFTAFNRSGIVSLYAEGEIDFDELSLVMVQKIVQTPFGKDKGLDRAIARAIDKSAADEKAAQAATV